MKVRRLKELANNVRFCTNHLQLQELCNKQYKSQSELPGMWQTSTNEVEFQEQCNKPHKSQSELPEMWQTSTKELEFHETQAEQPQPKHTSSVCRMWQTSTNKLELQELCNTPHKSYSELPGMWQTCNIKL